MSNNTSNRSSNRTDAASFDNPSSTHIYPYEWLLMLTLFPTLCTLYLCVFYLVCRNKDDNYKNSFYAVILGMGLCDFAMLIYVVYSFCYDVCGYNFLGPKVDSLLGYALYWSLGWYGTQFFNAFVATNRLMGIGCPSTYTRFTTKMAAACNALIIIGCLLGFYGLVYRQTDIAYTPRYKVPLFVQSEFFWAFRPVDTAVSYVVAGYVSLAYVVISIHLALKYAQIGAGGLIAVNYTKEVQLFAQGVCFWLLLGGATLVHWASPNGALNRLVNWLYCGLTPVVYVMLDSKLRRELLEIFTRLSTTLCHTHHKVHAATVRAIPLVATRNNGGT